MLMAKVVSVFIAEHMCMLLLCELTSGLDGIHLVLTNRGLKPLKVTQVLFAQHEAD